jgi:uncharacterized membrane protein
VVANDAGSGWAGSDNGGNTMARPNPSAAGPDGSRTRPGTMQRHPVVVAEQVRRAEDLQLRIADWITRFAGSMNFVYIHVVLFAAWMLLVESKPWPTLTLIVSLEAIFLSTFVLIGQNRQAAFQQAKADHDFNEQELELKTNTQLTREIDRLTTELHQRLLGTLSKRIQSLIGRRSAHTLRTLPYQERSRASDVLRLGVELPFPSVDVHRRPLASAAIVTQLVTRRSR